MQRATMLFLLLCPVFMSAENPTGDTKSKYLWPEGIVPYQIEADVPHPERIYSALNEWEKKTPIQFVLRQDEENYVRFVRENNQGLCFSSIGMIGGEQKVRVDDKCATGTLMHEIGHTVGLWHSQSRLDRGKYIVVMYENVQADELKDFNRHLDPDIDASIYDFGSIMHYSERSSNSKGLPSIVTQPKDIPIGQRRGLSPGDIDAVMRMYGHLPKEITITTHVSGLPITVDETSYTAPQSFNWAEGSVHCVSVSSALFARWSDGGEKAHCFTVEREKTTLYIANHTSPKGELTENARNKNYADK